MSLGILLVEDQLASCSTKTVPLYLKLFFSYFVRGSGRESLTENGPSCQSLLELLRTEYAANFIAFLKFLQKDDCRELKITQKRFQADGDSDGME